MEPFWGDDTQFVALVTVEVWGPWAFETPRKVQMGRRGTYISCLPADSIMTAVITSS